MRFLILLFIFLLFGCSDEILEQGFEEEKPILQEDGSVCVKVRHTSYRKAVFIPHVYISYKQETEFTYDLRYIKEKIGFHAYLEDMRLESDYPLSIKKFNLSNANQEIAQVSSPDDFLSEHEFSTRSDYDFFENEIDPYFSFDMSIKSKEVEVFYDFIVVMNFCGEYEDIQEVYLTLQEAKTSKATMLEIWKVKK